MARLLVGSEGTLAFFNEIELDLQPIPAHRVLGICHFPTFYSAMDATRKIVELGPSAVELVDRTMIELSRDIPMFRAVVDRFVKGEPAAVLLTEFAGDDPAENLRRLKALDELMGDLGFPGAVVEATDPAFQAAVWEVRAQGLNIMMSMKGDGKPISFLEDCAVRLEDLADYTDRLTRIFEKHGTYGTWYAHASVGCLHVRPVLNVKQELEVRKMRAIAEEAFAMVREYKGSHSGEHGDGLVRSEFHEAMFGGRMVRAFEEVKDAFDPHGLFNPGKIVRPSKMDDRSLFRFKPDYRPLPIATALDWSEWGGFAGAVEMCNNNGACRARDAARHVPVVPRHRRRAASDPRPRQYVAAGLVGPARAGRAGLRRYARDDGAVHLVQGLQARMPDRRRHGADEDRVPAPLPQTPRAQPARPADRLAAALRPLCRAAGAAAQSAQPGAVSGPARRTAVRAQRRRQIAANGRHAPIAEHRRGPGARSSCWSIPSTAISSRRMPAPPSASWRGPAIASLTPDPARGRPLCCGRTFLSAGLVDQARNEAQRMVDALAPYVAAGAPIVGLEPSCLLTLRDEFPALLPGSATKALAANAQLFEEFVDAERAAGRFELPLKPMPGQTALLHGHCHQKAFATVGAAVKALQLIPGLKVETFDSTCCGMAGSFGYEAEHREMSLKIGELGVLPTMRAAPAGTLLAACGTSCRHQIADATGRDARHLVRILDDASA